MQPTYLAAAESPHCSVLTQRCKPYRGTHIIWQTNHTDSRQTGKNKEWQIKLFRTSTVTGPTPPTPPLVTRHSQALFNSSALEHTVSSISDQHMHAHELDKLEALRPLPRCLVASECRCVCIQGQHHKAQRQAQAVSHAKAASAGTRQGLLSCCGLGTLAQNAIVLWCVHGVALGVKEATNPPG